MKEWVRSDSRARPVSDFTDVDSRTKSDFKDEVNINTIAAKMIRTQAPAEPTGRESYGDFSNVGDYKEAVDRLNDAQSSFEGLPAETRAHFANDPENLIAAFDDPDRVDELEQLGLVEVTREEVEGEPPAPPEPAEGTES